MVRCLYSGGAYQTVSSEQVPTSVSTTSAERWLGEHGDVLYAYAIRRVRDAHAAEDLVQETLLAAISAAGGYAALSAERTWLIGILKHKLIDHLRKSLRQRPVTEIEIEGNFDTFAPNGHWTVRVSSWRGDPRQTLENKEFRAVLASCLSKLPARTAEVFWLHEAESMNSKDVCKELGLSATNVWTMLHRARLGLQRCLTANWFEGSDR